MIQLAIKIIVTLLNLLLLLNLRVLLHISACRFLRYLFAKIVRDLPANFCYRLHSKSLFFLFYFAKIATKIYLQIFVRAFWKRNPYSFSEFC